MRSLESKHLEDRLVAIFALSEIGDEVALQRLRERLEAVNREIQALIIAVGKLKQRLKVK